MRYPIFALLVLCTCSSNGDDDDTAAATDDDSDAFVCNQEAGGENEDCPECVDEKCSDLLPFCEPADECECLVECLRQQGIGGIEGCLDLLGLPERPAGFAQIEECVAFACPDDDECATPEGWVPPGADLECDGLGAGGLGGGAEADCAFDPTLEFDPLGEVLQLQTEDGGFCVRLERSDEGPGSLQNTSWRLIDLRVGPLGEVAHVDDASGFCWYSSHHNFRDWVHVWTGSRHYDLVLKEDGHGGTEEGHDGQRRYHLYVFEEGPVDANACSPTASGVGCVEGPMVLFGYVP